MGKTENQFQYLNSLLYSQTAAVHRAHVLSIAGGTRGGIEAKGVIEAVIVTEASVAIEASVVIEDR